MAKRVNTNKKPKKPKNSDIDIVTTSSKSNDKKKMTNQKKFAIIAAICLVVIAIIVALVMIFGGSNGEQSSRDQYEEMASYYEEKGVNYSYEDWLKDQQAINARQAMLDQMKKKVEQKEEVEIENKDMTESNYNPNWGGVSSDEYIQYTQEYLENLFNDMSESTQKVIETNQDVIDDLNEQLDISSATLNMAKLYNAIIETTHAKNEFINTRLGWPVDEYPTIYMDNVLNALNAMTTGDISQVDQELYSYEDIKDAIIVSVWHEIQYSIYNKQSYEKNLLLNWLSNGHPNIDSINSCVLSEPTEDLMMIDEKPVSMIANISTDKGNYTCYVGYNVDPNVDSEFVIYDIIPS